MRRTVWGTVIYAANLGLTLGGLWYLLSGYTLPLLVFFGVCSVLLCLVIAYRMDLIDREDPFQMLLRAALYWPWLLKEIVIANLAVARVILSPGMPIQPRVLKVRGSQKTDVGQVTYANSITLTPGTVTIGVDNGIFTVHVLDDAAAQSILAGDMDRRVTRVEGAP